MRLSKSLEVMCGLNEKNILRNFLVTVVTEYVTYKIASRFIQTVRPSQ